MGKNLTREEIKPIVDDLVEELRKSPDGIRITTAELLVQAGHEEDLAWNTISKIPWHWFDKCIRALET